MPKIKTHRCLNTGKVNLFRFPIEMLIRILQEESEKGNEIRSVGKSTQIGKILVGFWRIAHPREREGRLAILSLSNPNDFAQLSRGTKTIGTLSRSSRQTIKKMRQTAEWRCDDEKIMFGKLE